MNLKLAIASPSPAAKQACSSTAAQSGGCCERFFNLHKYQIKGMTPITFKLSGAIVPKSRPRVTRHGTFMPKPYKDWKTAAIVEFRLQWAAMGQVAVLEGVGIEIFLSGKHSRRGDLDNIAGSILDSLVQSGVLRNDNLICVMALSVRLEYGKTEPTTQINIVPISAPLALTETL